jgi:hypothetical protein
MAQQGDDTRIQTAAEAQIEEAHRAHDQQREFALRTNDAAINSGQLALRTAVLINGGAAVAVLAFLGGLAGQGRISVGDLGRISNSLLWFGGGVVLAGAGLAFGYVTNFCHMKELMSRVPRFEYPYFAETRETSLWQRRGLVAHWAAIVVGVLSLVAFIFGMVAVRNSVKKLHERPTAALLTDETNIVKHESGRVVFIRFTEV